ncbi:MAG: Crp/Fnr family transcriptional regulator [Pleurocapsa sp.]
MTSNIYLEREEEELLLQFYEKGEEISIFDTGVWQVYKGVVQLSRISHDGKEVILGWGTSNTAFGSWLNDPPHYRALALSDVYVKWYAEKDIQRSSSLARSLLAQFSDRLIQSEQLLAIAAIRKIEERLWQLLLLLQNIMGQQGTDGIRLQVRFTHQQLAEIICTTRVTVTRVLGTFQDRGWISIDSDRHIMIKSQNN